MTSLTVCIIYLSVKYVSNSINVCHICLFFFCQQVCIFNRKTLMIFSSSSSFYSGFSSVLSTTIIISFTILTSIKGMPECVNVILYYTINKNSLLVTFLYWCETWLKPIVVTSFNLTSTIYRNRFSFVYFLLLFL